MKDIYAQVGSLEHMGSDFAGVWLAAEQGKQAEAREVIYFETITDMYRVLSVKRIELLNVLHASGAMSIYALAKLLERSYKNVHTDTKLLAQYGLIVMAGDKITAPYDMIHVDVPLMQAA
jgi:predicted transcriptional regulator